MMLQYIFIFPITPAVEIVILRAPRLTPFTWLSSAAAINFHS